MSQLITKLSGNIDLRIGEFEYAVMDVAGQGVNIYRRHLITRRSAISRTNWLIHERLDEEVGEALRGEYPWDVSDWLIAWFALELKDEKK